MRAFARVVLTICLLLGVLFMGQGVGFVRGSFMTGRVEWAVIGSVLAALGAIGLWALTRPREQPPA